MGNWKGVVKGKREGSFRIQPWVLGIETNEAYVASNIRQCQSWRLLNHPSPKDHLWSRAIKKYLGVDTVPDLNRKRNRTLDASFFLGDKLLIWCTFFSGSQPILLGISSIHIRRYFQWAKDLPNSMCNWSTVVPPLTIPKILHYTTAGYAANPTRKVGSHHEPNHF